MITAHLENLFAHKIGENGISQAQEHEFAETRVRIAHKIVERLQAKKYGFVNHVLTAADLDVKAISTYLKKHKWIKTLVVVGIGGSDLGGRAIRQALASELATQSPKIDLLFHGDSTDPNDITWLLDRLDLEGTLFNVVSKSGTTLEVMTQYLLLKGIMEQHKPRSWRKHFVFTTDPEDGLLNKESRRNRIKTFKIPTDVGGRYSVLTAVGLLPAMAIGVDVDQMLAGARQAVNSFKANPVDSLPMLIAWSQMLLYKQGYKAVVAMPYSTRLNEFTRWFRQLWAESLGKSGKGILPIQSWGPADQHSQLQFYTQGELLASFMLFSVGDHQNNYKIGHVDIPELAYLSHKHFGDIINIQHRSTQAALTSTGRPNASLHIDRVDAFTLGEMFMVFMLAVVCLAEMMGVDAFDQPGVEEVKQLSAQMLAHHF